MDPRIERLFEKLGCIPDLRERLAQLRELYILDYRLRPEIEQILYKLAENYRNKIILEPPPKEECKGDLFIGYTFCEKPLHPFYLRLDELTRHMAIYGASGSGKTTLVDRIASERLKTKEPLIIFDWDGSHRHLLQRPEGRELKYYTIGDNASPFHFNPFIVPEEMTREQRATFFMALLNSLVERHLPGSSVTKRSIKIYLKKRVEELLNQGAKAFTFADLQRSYWKGRSFIPISDFLSQFVEGPLGQVLNTTKQTDVVKLFSEQTLLDLSHLVNQEERADFIDLLLSYAYEVFFKRKRIALANSLKVLIIIEEVHVLFQQQENIITSFFREVRKWGGGLVITDQNPSAIPRFIRGNTFYTMVLHLGSKEDIEIMSRAMMLNGDERHYLTMLHAGEGIGIMKMQSRFTKPFLVKIAPIE